MKKEYKIKCAIIVENIVKIFKNKFLAIQFENKTLIELTSFCQNSSTSVESGGILMGKRLFDGNILITDISVPQKGDIRKRNYFKKNSKLHQRISDTIWKNSSGNIVYLGEWHTHPENIPTPSSIDLRGWALSVKKQEDNKTYIFLIVGIKKISIWSYDLNNGLLEMKSLE